MVVDLRYGTNPGCAASVSAAGGTPGQCQGVEEFAVPHRFKYPRPQLVRLFICARHAREHGGAEPLTDDDRQTITARRARWDGLLAPSRCTHDA